MSGGGRLAGRRIVLTGASSGIGLAAGLALANEGADLVLLARGERGLKRAVELTRARGVQAHALPVDVADRDGIEAAIEEAAELLGGIDVFVSNAAATAYGPFSEIAPNDFERTIEVTLLGAVHGVRTALPHLERTRGTVIGVASILSRVPMPLFAGYVAAKHGLRGFLGSLRIELRVQALRLRSPWFTRVTSTRPSGTASRAARAAPRHCLQPPTTPTPLPTRLSTAPCARGPRSRSAERRLASAPCSRSRVRSSTA